MPERLWTDDPATGERRFVPELEDLIDERVREHITAQGEARRKYLYRPLLVWTALVSGVVALFVSHLFDVDSFNTLRDFQATSCEQRVHNTKIGNKNVGAIKVLVGDSNLPPVLRSKIAAEVRIYEQPDCSEIPHARGWFPINF